MIPFLQRYALAIACITAPFLLGLWSSSVTVAWLMASGDVGRIQIDYVLRDQPAPGSQRGAGGGQKSERDAAAPASAKGDAKADPAARIELVARHLSGLVTFGLASAFMYFICVVACAVSAMIIRRRLGGRMLALAVAGFAVITAMETWLIIREKQRRILVTENIFQLADRHDLLRHMPVADRMVELVAFNVYAGLFPVGMLFTALAVASVRRGPAVDRKDLEDRLFVIRVTLVMASVLLVVAAVLQAKALVEWPISLLAEAQRKAIDPAGDALARLWAGSSSIALLAAFLPGIAAWYLDRRDYRAAHPSPDARADGLDIAPLSTVTAILAILAPVVASPILDVAKSLVGAVGSK